MERHERYAAIAVDKLKDVLGVIQIDLFGSVSRGCASRDSDIDLAVIVDDSMRGFLTGQLSEFPYCIDSDVSGISRELEENGSPKLHIGLYYKSEYDRGVELHGNKGFVDVLNEVGVVKYREVLF